VPEKPDTAVLSGTAVRLSWDAVPGAGAYELWVSVAPLGTYEKIYFGIARSYTDLGLTPGVPAYYKLRAVKSVEGHIYAGPFSGVTVAVPLSVPGAPSAMRALSSVRLSWSAVPGATGCELWRAVSPAGKYRKVYAGSALNYTDSGLTGGTAYSYKLRAYKQLGTYTYHGPFGPATIGKPIDMIRLPPQLLP